MLENLSDADLQQELRLGKRFQRIAGWGGRIVAVGAAIYGANEIQHGDRIGALTAGAILSTAVVSIAAGGLGKEQVENCQAELDRRAGLQG